SATANAEVSTLTVSGLLSNTTYFFRVASLNHASSTSPFTALGSTSTLTNAPISLAEVFLAVYKTSVTANWASLPTNPPDASSKTCEGYVLEASSTNFGALSPGGLIVSSLTLQVLQSTLTVHNPALETGTTYYFRVGALNWTGAPNFTALGSTKTHIDGSASVAADNAASSAPFNNQGKLSAFLMLTVAPDLSASHGASLSSVRVTWASGTLAALTNGQAQAVLSSMSIVLDALDPDTTGVFHPGIDTEVVANLDSADFTLDGSGRQVLAVPSPAPSAAHVPPGTTRRFFVVARWAQDAADPAKPTDTARAAVDADADAVLRDPAEDDSISVDAAASVASSSVTVISSAPSPAGWPVDLGGPAASVEGGFAINDDGDASFAGTNDGKLVALGNDGTPLWTFTTTPAGAIKTYPTVNNEGGTDYIYFANDQGDVYKIRDNGGTWTQMWKKDLTGAFLGAPVFTNDALYIGAPDQKVYKLDITNGNTLWTSPESVTGVFSATPFVDEYSPGTNSLYIGSENGSIYRLKTADGDVSTYADFSGAAVRTTPILDSGLVVAEQNTYSLYWGADDGKLRARQRDNLSNPPDGWSDFTVSPQQAIRTTPYLDSNEAPKALYFGCDNGKVYKLRADTGAELWSFQTGGKVRTLPIPLLDLWTGAGATYVYFGSDDGKVYGLDASNGTLRPGFPVDVGAPVRSGPVFDSGTKTITVGSLDGKTLRIGVGP
ncbi:MAG: PQQ-binding-like beta-propeller repeat protein, partial [Elusimicrobiota bacterium]